MGKKRNYKINIKAPFFGFVGLIFVFGKVFGYLDWSWWLVLLPFYFGIALVLGILGLAFMGGGLVFLGAVILDAFDVAKQRIRVAYQKFVKKIPG